MRRIIIGSSIIAFAALAFVTDGAVVRAQTKASPPPAAVATALLLVTVNGGTPLSLTVADLASMPRATLTMSDQGESVRYDGVKLFDILKRAGAPLGSALRGKALASYILVEAKDGYRVVLTLADIDPDFSGRDVLVADSRDGKPLFDYQGPLQLVFPGEAHAARSVRMLTKISVVRVPE